MYRGQEVWCGLPELEQCLQFWWLYGAHRDLLENCTRATWVARVAGGVLRGHGHPASGIWSGVPLACCGFGLGDVEEQERQSPACEGRTHRRRLLVVILGSTTWRSRRGRARPAKGGRTGGLLGGAWWCACTALCGGVQEGRARAAKGGRTGGLLVGTWGLPALILAGARNRA